MKFVLLAFFLASCGLQKIDPLQPEVDEILACPVEAMASFPGGMEKCYEFILKNFEVPSSSKHQLGRIFVSFIVEVDGSLTNIEVVKSIDQDWDKEALRVFALMPKWDPAKLSNVNVRSKVVFPLGVKSKK